MGAIKDISVEIEEDNMAMFDAFIDATPSDEQRAYIAERQYEEGEDE